MWKTALATIPAMLLGQAGRTPFSNYVIKADETRVTGAIGSSCSSYSRFQNGCLKGKWQMAILYNKSDIMASSYTNSDVMPFGRSAISHFGQPF